MIPTGQAAPWLLCGCWQIIFYAVEIGPNGSWAQVRHI